MKANRKVFFGIGFFFALFIFCSWEVKQTGQSTVSRPSRDAKTVTDSGKLHVRMGDRFKIEISNDGKQRQFPFIYHFGNDVFISYAEHRDAVMKSPVDAMLVSHDNGKSWSKKITHADFYITSMIERNGILYGVVYFTYPLSKKQERMIYWTSADYGETWIKHQGKVHSGSGWRFMPGDGTWGNLLFHRGMTVMEDGSIQGVMYGHIKGEKKYTCVWVKSTNNCADWKIVSIIASGAPEGFEKAEGYCEPTFSSCMDGSLLCVMRIGSYLPLFQSRSFNQGKNWSKPQKLPGLDPAVTQSVCPQLLLMNNGVLALTYGRPGDKIAFAADGNGNTWDLTMDSYLGETTGYSGIIEAGSNRILLVSDQGRTGAKEPAIWGRYINVSPQ